MCECWTKGVTVSLIPVHLTSYDHETAERKVHLETMFFVADVRARRA